MTPVSGKSMTVEVRVMDAPEVIAALTEARKTIDRLRAERDEWERMYDLLLDSTGRCKP